MLCNKPQCELAGRAAVSWAMLSKAGLQESQGGRPDGGKAPPRTSPAGQPDARRAQRLSRGGCIRVRSRFTPAGLCSMKTGQFRETLELPDLRPYLPTETCLTLYPSART